MVAWWLTMRLHPEELQLARAWQRETPFEVLTEEQLGVLAARGRELRTWFKGHAGIHNSISVLVILFLFTADWWVLFGLPARMLGHGEIRSYAALIPAALLTGALHSYLLYSLGVFSMHEGASHHWIFLGRGGLARAASWISRNLCRVAACDPEHYSIHHVAHHNRFGTEGDGEFLNFVRPNRFWTMLLPLGAFLNYGDFLSHRAETYTKSRLLSAAFSILYSGTLAVFLYHNFGGWFTLIALGICFPHFGFYLDRLRQFVEHNLMPLDNANGSRSLGCGFWGLLIGGGPWGSPCHWEHHLVAGVPWYHQILVHFELRRMLTAQQRRQFLIQPVIGFPKLWWRLMSELRAFERRTSVKIRSADGSTFG
jgi:hypothetical protein